MRPDHWLVHQVIVVSGIVPICCATLAGSGTVMVKVKGASRAGTGATLNACPGWRCASSTSATTTSAAALALVHRTIVGPSWYRARDCAASNMAQPPFGVVTKVCWGYRRSHRSGYTVIG